MLPCSTEMRQPYNQTGSKDMKTIMKLLHTTIAYTSPLSGYSIVRDCTHDTKHKNILECNNVIGMIYSHNMEFIKLMVSPPLLHARGAYAHTNMHNHPYRHNFTCAYPYPHPNLQAFMLKCSLDFSQHLPIWETEERYPACLVFQRIKLLFATALQLTVMSCEKKQKNT